MNPPYTNLEAMVAYYRALAARNVWECDYPDLDWTMSQRYGSRLRAFVFEARVIRDAVKA
jgi:hypothetical protein